MALMRFLLLCCLVGRLSADQDIPIYEIQSTADLINLDAENSGSPWNPDNTDDENASRDTLNSMDTAVIALYSIIIFVGLIANSVVFFVIFAGNEIGKTVTTIYILQLTIADSVFLLTLPVFSMQKLSNTWNFGPAVCAICQTIKFFNYYAGIFFLTAMSIDRYIAVAYSTRLTQIRTKERTYLVCALVWVAAIIMSIPLMLYARIEEGHGIKFCRVMFPGYQFLHDKETSFYVDYYYGEDPGSDANAYYDISSDGPIIDDSNMTNYNCAFESQPRSYKIWLGVDFAVAFVIPFSVIVLMYAMILIHLKTVEHKIGHTATNRAVRMRRRVTKMVAALVVCFTICWLPHHILMLAKISGFKSSVAACYGMEELFIALAFSNSALNPLLYTFMGNNFRERFKKSVHNTQLVVKRRTSSRGSGFRRSMNSQSGDVGQKRFSGAVLYRKSSFNEENSANGKQKKCHINLLGAKKERSGSDGSSIEDSQRAEVFCPATSLLDHTMQTKLDA